MTTWKDEEKWHELYLEMNRLNLQLATRNVELSEKLRMVEHGNRELLQEIEALKSGDHPAVRKIVEERLKEFRDQFD